MADTNIYIYHGSDHILERPVYGAGKQYNDYGRGFYCTEDKKMACEWAVDCDRSGYVNSYEIDTNGLNLLNMNQPEYCILHWLTILLKNRTFEIHTPIAVEAVKYLRENFSIDYENFDIISGYRADDSYFSFAQDFLNNMISYRQLEQAMKLGNLGQQFVLKSKTAFEHLKYQNYEVCESREWYPKKEMRDKMARNDYFNLDKNKWHRGDIYMMQILDEEMKSDDPRLR